MTSDHKHAVKSIKEQFVRGHPNTHTGLTDAIVSKDGKHIEGR